MLDFGANPQLQHLLPYASCFALPLTRKARFRLAGWAFAGWESNPLDRCERFQLVLTIILPSCSPDASAIKRWRPTVWRIARALAYPWRPVRWICSVSPAALANVVGGALRTSQSD